MPFSNRRIVPEAGRRILVLLLFVALGIVQIAMNTVPADAHHTSIVFPFESGRTWSVLQGYNTDPSVNYGTHYNCDPSTLKDSVQQKVSCSAAWQYRYSIDFYESNNRSAGLTVLAPASGTVRWTQASTGGISINLGDGYAIALFHVILDSSITPGTTLTQGQRIGTVAPANVAGAGNNPHIHMTLWETTDGGNWSRIARPFTGATAIEGISFPDLGASVFNQHRGKQVTSTNPPASSSRPAAPAIVSPAVGATIANGSNGVTFTWKASAGADSYNVVIHNVGYSGWRSGTSWTSGPLAPGTYRWQVSAKNASGESGWGQEGTFTVTSGTSTPAASLSSVKGAAGAVVTVSGSGFRAGETVEIRWDSATAAPIRTITANASGAFTTQITIPDATRGAHKVLVRGTGSGVALQPAYEVTPSMQRTPTQGAPGTAVSVTVKGFAANEDVKITWRTASGTLLATARTNGNGTGTASISIPNGAPGWTDYVGTGQTSKATAYGAINVLSKLYIYPNPVTASSRANVDAGGVTPNTAFTVHLNGTALCSGTSSADGIVRCPFTVPNLGAGGYDIILKVGTITLSDTLVVTGPPAVSVSPGDRKPGINITISAGGFQPNEAVTFLWDNAAWQKATADEYGSIGFMATVPQTSTGNHIINARGATSGRTATFAYRVGTEGNISGSSMISTGVYSVFATREGLVGGTTSSGHVIVENDYFVALPGCTPSNCGGGFTPGNMTQCGDRCYVKVTNPATGVCRVEPIYDTGPWFTVDDWWNPTDSRYLNNLASNPNTLAQGYPAAEAARNGLDVGYGRGPNGIGYDNTGTIPGRPYREVGNPAAIDLADGTWYALAPQGNSVGATIRVEMLWQTGANPSQSAVACGHPLNQPGGSEVSFPPGTANPSFSGERLAITNTFASQNTGSARNAIDGNAYSNWTSANTTPGSASITFDLGSNQNVSGISWLYTYTGFADSFTVSVKTSAGAVTNLGQFGNTPGNRQWYGVAPSRPAFGRYVVLTFANPNRDRTLGSLGEVRIWGTPANPPGVANPSTSGLARIPLTNAYDSPSTGSANAVHDGVLYTNWATASNSPSSATLTVDLGWNQDISTIRWSMASLGYADEFTVRVRSSDGSWQTLGLYGNPPATNTWYGIKLSSPRTVRFVELRFANPNRDFALGGIGEIEVWGQKTYYPGLTNPSFTGSSQQITNSFDYHSTGTTRVAYDGQSWTNWTSPRTTPSVATITFDLGRQTELSGIRWMFPYVGYADQFEVKVSTDNRTWTRLGTFGNGTASYTWFGTRTSATARFVQFSFGNPNRDVVLGSLGEVQIWGQGASAFAAASIEDPDLAGEILPVSCVATGAPSAFGYGPELACDRDGGTWWSTEPVSPDEVTLTATLEQPATLTGVRWNAAAIDGATFTVTIGDQTYGPFASSMPGTYGGFALPEPVVGDTVTIAFTNVLASPTLGNLAELEIWGSPAAEASPEAPLGTPVASPEGPAATPVVTGEPAGTPVANPVATGEPTEIPATPVVTEAPLEIPATPVATEEPTSTPTEEPIEAPATPVVTEQPTEAPATPVATEAPTLEPTTEPTAPATLEPTAEPTAAVIVGTITGTDGDLVNCRLSPVDGEPITQLAEGEQVAITGEAVDGWYPVTCAGQDGWIAEQFITIGEVLPTAPVDDASPTSEPTEPTEAADGTEEPTEEPTLEPTAEPTEEPVVIQPYEIVDTGDTAESGTAWNTQDGDPTTAWLAPVTQPQVRLYLDLGSVHPIQRLDLTMAWVGNLPRFEIWVSEDAETWYNATPSGIDGGNLWSGEAIPFELMVDARYIRIVIPHADASGLAEVGGIGEIAIWPAAISETRHVSALGSPTTPTPPPMDPTEEPLPTEAPTEEPVIADPTEEWIPTEEPVTAAPTEEPVWEAPTAVPEVVEPEPTVEDAVG